MVTTNLIPWLMAAALAAPVAAQAASTNVEDLQSGTYVIDKQHSFVTTRVTHMGVSIYVARFNRFDATMTYDKGKQTASLQASVDAGSMDVGADYSGRFAEEFLAASKFPKITFASTSAASTAPGKGTITGNLTLRGVTKPVTWDVTFNGTGKSPLPPMNTIAGFTARTTIKRSDFGSDFMSNGGVVADEVTITVDGEFDRR